jgi:hypothetical protein
MGRLPANDDELWWTIYALWGVRVPRISVCPDHVAPFAALSDAYFARHPVSVWLASRGLGGKSRTLAALGSTEAALLGIEVTILGGSAAQSQNVHVATQEQWSWYGAPKTLLRSPNRYETVLSNGGHLRTLTASQTSVRGPHPPRLRIDEVDEVPISILDAALGQPMEQEGVGGMIIPTNTVLSSTHQYPDSTMTEVLKRALIQDWPVYRWCYKETSEPTYGWLSSAAIERSKSTVSKAAWDREFDLQEPSFENRAFDTDSVERAFVTDWGTFVGDHMVLAPPTKNRHYLTAIDWAKQRDQTVITTFDTTDHPWVCVAWKKVNGLPWPQLVHEAVKQYRVYGGKMVHDRTGVGEFAHDQLRSEMTTGEFAKVEGVIMTGGRSRDAFYNDYIAAIEHDDIRYPRIQYVYDEHRYASNDMLFTSKEHAPDSIVSGALAWSQRKRGVPIVIPGGMARESSPWIV